MESAEIFPGIPRDGWMALSEPNRVIAEATSNAIITGHPCFIVGPSGVGKSTVVAAVLRHFLGDSEGRSESGLHPNGLYEITMHPGVSAMVVTGGPDLPALVQGRYETTTEGSMMDPRVRAVLIDELPLGSPSALDAMLRRADMPGRPIIATGNTRVPIGSIGRSYWDALLDRFGTCHVPPHRVSEGTGFRVTDVALRAAGERFRSLTSGEPPRRGVELDIGRFRLPRYDEMCAFYQSVRQSSTRISVDPRVREAINDLIDALSSGEHSGDDRFVISLNHRNVTSLCRSLVSVALFEQWRRLNREHWQSIYDNPDADRRQAMWVEYAAEAARNQEWTHITHVSMWNAHNLVVVLPTENHKMALWALHIVLSTLQPVIAVSSTHHHARRLLEAVKRMDAAAYTSIASLIDNLTLPYAGRALHADPEIDPGLRDLALLSHAMRLPMIERAVMSEEHVSNRDYLQRYYSDTLPELKRAAQERGLEFGGHRPMHALAMQIQLDTWPLEGLDLDIVMTLERAFQVLMNRHQTSWNPHAGVRGSR